MSPVPRGRVVPPPGNRGRLLPLLVFVVVFVLHALYVRRVAALPADGWDDTGVGAPSGLWGLGAYLEAGDYFLGFSYATGAAFAVWALVQFMVRRGGSSAATHAAGAAGGLTLVGALMAGGCFLLGCCGSPMLAVYLGIFGAKALGAGKPLMALITLLSVGCGWWCLSQRFRAGSCVDSCCESAACLPGVEQTGSRLT